MKLKTILLLSILITNSYTQDWKNKLDPYLSSIYCQFYDSLSISKSNNEKFNLSFIPLDYELYNKLNFEPIVRTLIVSTGDKNNLVSCGIKIESKVGNIYTAHIPLSKLPIVAELDEVKCIQLGHKVYPNLDISADYIRAPEARNAFDVDGSGIIFGIIDSGIDISNEDFKNEDGTTRILYIWDQLDQGGPSPGSFDYGTEWNSSSINNGTCREVDNLGHGTHVAGIAVGNGRATGNGQPANVYIGIAPKADLIVVKLDFSNFANVIDGLTWLASKAASLNKPWVVNLSIGTNFGPHDGTSLFETAITGVVNQSDLGKGRIIVVSAGNSGYDPNNVNSQPSERIHMSGQTSGTGTFTVNSSSNSNEEQLWIQIWYPESTEYSITLETPTGAQYGPYFKNQGTGDPNQGYVTEYGLISIHNEHWNDQSNKRLYYPFTPDNMIDIYLGDITFNGTLYSLRNGNWVIHLEGGSGRWDVYIPEGGGVSGGVYFTTGSYENARVIIEPGNANKTLTVGSFNSKNSWIDIDGINRNFEGYTPGEISYFSSPGPTRDGRTKPDIYAPGAWIASSRSDDGQFIPPDRTWIARDGAHYHNQGTSMAAPHLSGAVALLLEQDNDYLYQDIKAIVDETKTAAGFLDVYEAILLNYQNPASLLTNPKSFFFERGLIFFQCDPEFFNQF